MERVTYHVPGISCNHCVNTIEMEVSELEGVSEVRADAGSKMVDIAFQRPASRDKLVELLEAIGYPIQE